ncbi:glutathione S-transferase, N-terminal domain protein [Collimonas arenae]|uniref:glutathione S-transferase family protein n=1 Tax=Collimonas arenae TaxID=279058 RepID=UPI00078BCE47|nr:glutathione S-transferase [Collimonas arenae]AMO99656.1 glutathione S-transferase, N-terminal domain protein [Collimonas arenae]
MYTLYGFKGSGSAAVEAALEMAGLPYRRVEAASWAPASAIDELQRVNPLMQIPTLQLPDGAILTESAAILLHLGLHHPSSHLLPIDPGQRAQAIRGLVFIAANCYAAIGVIDFPERWCVDADTAVQEQIRLGATERLHRNWEIFADTFPQHPFLSGSRPAHWTYWPQWSPNGRAHAPTWRRCARILPQPSHWWNVTRASRRCGSGIGRIDFIWRGIEAFGIAGGLIKKNGETSCGVTKRVV